jgi:type IV fimbrial biogenesis protein FimT
MNRTVICRGGSAEHGLSSLELLCVLAVVSIVAVFAAPGLRALRQQAALVTSANTLLGHLHYARGLAILRNSPAVLCLSADGRQCAARTTQPLVAWLVFLNLDRDAPPRVDAGEPVTRATQLAAGVRMSATRLAVTYWPVSRAGTTATFTLCVAEPAANARDIIVSQSGRPRLRTRSVAASSCVAPTQ